MAGKKHEVDVAKELDAVVGERFAPPRRALPALLRWAAAAVLAILAMAAIAWTLDRHVTQAQRAPAPDKPVTVRIVPAK